jgi:hypothetical protein
MRNSGAAMNSLLIGFWGLVLILALARMGCLPICCKHSGNSQAVQIAPFHAKPVLGFGGVL